LISTAGADRANFGLSEYTDATGRKLKEYIITRNGVTFLVIDGGFDKFFVWHPTQICEAKTYKIFLCFAKEKTGARTCYKFV